MATLYICRGLPASGKTTYAKAWVAEDPGQRVRVSRDDLRCMAHGTPDVGVNENAVTSLQHGAIENALLDKWDVISDATNLQERHVRDLRSLADWACATVEVLDHFLAITPEECIRRDADRRERGERHTGADVIRDMWSRYQQENS